MWPELQEAIFQLVGQPITESCLQGYHGCLLAYGQTGAGKTFTMQGPSMEHTEEVRRFQPYLGLRDVISVSNCLEQQDIQRDPV